MTTQQTDIEKTLKRILARELKEWPEGAEKVMLPMIEFSHITRADWEAERVLLASEKAQTAGDAEEFDQALWDKVASESMSLFAATVQITKADVTYSFVAETACNVADAFMAERAKRIAARKGRDHG